MTPGATVLELGSRMGQRRLNGASPLPPPMHCTLRETLRLNVTWRTPWPPLIESGRAHRGQPEEQRRNANKQQCPHRVFLEVKQA
jgi:hypothetical protein